MDIIIKNISKRFNDKLVLNNFSTTIKSGEYNIIMGKSGCGKTTLLNILMGFIKPDGGLVSGMPEKMSAVFQENRLIESLSGVINIKLACPKKSREEIITELKKIGLNDSFDIPVSELSGGMKRRVAIVRAIMAEYDILFLDEPLKELDSGNHSLALSYILNRTKGKTVIFVTHDEADALIIGGKIIKLQ